MATDTAATSGPDIDPAVALLESGKFDDSTDVTLLAAALNGTADLADQGEPPAPKDAPPPAEPPPAADSAPAELDPTAAPPTGDEGTPPEASDSRDDPANFKSHPMYGVLKGTRQTLSETRRREAESRERAERLERENRELTEKLNAKGSQATDDVQRAADAAGIVDASGRPIDVTTIDIDKLREDYDGPIVDAIAALQGIVKQQQGVIQNLTSREAQRQVSDEELIQEGLRADIDAVPQLAEWEAAEDSRNWNRAIALDETLMKEPDWKNRPRVERFQEVVRILGGQQPPAKPSPGADARVDAALRAAAARAAPTSLSELPSGSPAGQSEQETLEGLDVVQIAEKMSGMSPAQQEAFLARLG